MGLINKLRSIRKDNNSRIFHITSKCKRSCKFCFVDKSRKDMSLYEIGELFKKEGEFDNMLLSGGEPFLRDDLADIVSVLVKWNKIKSITIPTRERNTDKVVGEIQKRHPKLAITISRSYDIP